MLECFIQKVRVTSKERQRIKWEQTKFKMTKQKTKNIIYVSPAIFWSRFSISSQVFIHLFIHLILEATLRADPLSKIIII